MRTLGGISVNSLSGRNDSEERAALGLLAMASKAGESIDTHGLGLFGRWSAVRGGSCEAAV